MTALAHRKVLVTGGAGLIGSFLVERLVAAGAAVRVADDFSKGQRAHLARVADRIEIIEGDLEGMAAMEAALDGQEVVFHLASRAFGVGYSAGRHLDILEHNERITTNLLGCLRRMKVAHVLATSSSCVYRDDGPDTLTERALYDGEPEAVNWGYGWAKRLLEQKMLLLARDTGVKLTVVRPFNIYGERYTWMGENSQAIPMQVVKILRGDDPVVIWGSGRQRRNYLHAADCADAMAGLVEHDFVGAVNIGTEDTVTMTELVETICRAAGRAPKLVYDTTKPEGRAIKSADSALLRRAYPGFARTIDLDQGMRRMVDWYARTFPTP